MYVYILAYIGVHITNFIYTGAYMHADVHKYIHAAITCIHTDILTYSLKPKQHTSVRT